MNGNNVLKKKIRAAVTVVRAVGVVIVQWYVCYTSDLLLCLGSYGADRHG